MHEDTQKHQKYLGLRSASAASTLKDFVQFSARSETSPKETEDRLMTSLALALRAGFVEN